MDGDQTSINNSSDHLVTLLLLSGQNSPPLEQFFSQILQKSSEEHLYISCMKTIVREHGRSAGCPRFCCSRLFQRSLQDFRQNMFLTVLGLLIFPPGGAMLRLLASRAPTGSPSSSVLQMSRTRLDLSITTALIGPILVLLLLLLLLQPRTITLYFRK